MITNNHLDNLTRTYTFYYVFSNNKNRFYKALNQHCVFIHESRRKK